MLQQTPQSQAMVFTLPAGYIGDRENSHKRDQILYVIEGSATCRVSGQECTIKTGDLVTIPAGAPHALRTSDKKFFALTVFAPPKRRWADASAWSVPPRRVRVRWVEYDTIFQEAADGYDAVEWAARLPWSNGQSTVITTNPAKIMLILE